MNDQPRFYRSALMMAMDLQKLETTAGVALSCGVSEDTFDRWLDGLDVPTEHQIERIAFALFTPKGWFYQRPPLLEGATVFDLLEAGEVHKLTFEDHFSDWTDYPPYEEYGRVSPTQALEQALYGDAQGRTMAELVEAVKVLKKRRSDEDH